MRTTGTLLLAAFLAVIGLKVSGTISTSWFWVTSPIWGAVAVPFIAVAIGAYGVCFLAVCMAVQSHVSRLLGMGAPGKMYEVRYDEEGYCWQERLIAEAVATNTNLGGGPRYVRDAIVQSLSEREMLRSDRRTRLFGEARN